MQPSQQPQTPSNNYTGNSPTVQPTGVAPTPNGGSAGQLKGAQPRTAANNIQEARRTQNSTQNSLLISELRDNIVIMNDGSMRAVIACQSINFDLMSGREREGVEFAYQNFLNSLYFPIQILVRSQKVDIGPYLEKLAKLRSSQDNLLLGVLMDDYIDFIASIAQETNIMDKSFYVILPYYLEGDMTNTIATSKNLLISLFSSQSQQRIRIDEPTFEKSKDELRNRVQTVIAGLMQIGIRGTQLSTKELGELYYNMYNPDTAVRQPIGNFENLMAPVITRGSGPTQTPGLNRGTV